MVAKRALLATTAAVLLVLVAPAHGVARRWPPAVRIECSSLKDRYNYCRTHTVGRVRLERQLSKSACRQYQTWGSDGDGSGVWVRDGCRGVFVVDRGSWSGGNQRPRRRTITCTSRDYGYAHCAVSTWGRDVWLARQLSRERCVRGDNWGVDWRGIWVDRGCNAEFVVD
ncbi:MAG: DUF3011 domain-containing protein [Thermodesulfobacteriota bacterium]